MQFVSPSSLECVVPIQLDYFMSHWALISLFFMMQGDYFGFFALFRPVIQ